MTGLFGTDGIRSTDTQALCQWGYQLGRALEGKSKVLVAKDNRPTSDKIAASVMAGLRDAEVDILYGGIMPTPAVQYATVYHTADAGIVVTASHNPPCYNGLKYVDADGRKPDAEMAERLSTALEAIRPVDAEYTPTVQDNLLKSYTRKFTRVGRLPLRVAVDCANGAGYPVVKHILSLHGAEGVYLHHGAGKQINHACGATCPDLAGAGEVDMGFALDGDGDRCMLMTPKGRWVDGDGILYLLALDSVRRGNPLREVVGTIMSNGALSSALSALGGRLVRTDVGDGNVWARMLRDGATLGGEPSGHILTEDGVSDGIGTGILLMQMAMECDLDEALAGWHPIPQCHTQCPRREDNLRRALAAAEKWQDYLGGTGRVVVRPSGTESVLRIMAECPEESLARTVAESIAQAAVKR